MANKRVNTPPVQKKYYHLIPLIIIVALIPLVSKVYVYNPKLSEFSWFPPLTSTVDVFLHYKSTIFVLLSVFMALVIIGKLFLADKKPYTPKLFIPLAIYGGLALLSSIVSHYASYSFSGIYEHFESIWVIIGYCITAYYAYLFVEDEDDIHFLMRWFLVGVALMMAIGLSQAFSHDFFRTEFGKKLLIGDSGLTDLNFNFALGRVYMSLYNPNYVGYYVAFIIPILLCCILFYRPSNKKDNKLLTIEIIELFIYGILIVGLFYCLVKAQAKNGIVALAIALFCLIFVSLRKIKKYWYIGILGLLFTVGSFLYADKALNHVVTNSVKAMFTTEKTTYDLEDIKLSEDGVKITYKGNDILFQITDDYDVAAWDSNENSLVIVPSEADFSYVIEDERFSALPISLYPAEQYFALDVKINGLSWVFAKDNELNTYLYRNSYGKWVTFEAAESVFFTGREKIASGRGYIWSRTIPLLKDYIFLGSGADTFSIAFPNDDYVGLYNSGYHAMTMTKPHNLYLQIGVQSGVLSLIAFLTFYVMYFISSIKAYAKGRFDTYSSRIGLGIFLGSIGYMISGIINDSTITVAPIFWTFIGVGISINVGMIKKNKELN